MNRSHHLATTQQEPVWDGRTKCSILAVSKQVLTRNKPDSFYKKLHVVVLGQLACRRRRWGFRGGQGIEVRMQQISNRQGKVSEAEKIGSVDGQCL